MGGPSKVSVKGLSYPPKLPPDIFDRFPKKNVFDSKKIGYFKLIKFVIVTHRKVVRSTRASRRYAYVFLRFC